MAIASISLSNTFAQWLTTTQNIVTEINKIESGSYTKTANTLFITSTGTGLYVTNTAIMGTGSVLTDLSVGRTLTVSGNSSLISRVSVSQNNITFATSAPNANVIIAVNRGEATNPANANAQIMWNESVKNWQLRDVDNSSLYYTIITDNDNANTTVAGIVQLYDNTDSTSTVLAATANSVKKSIDYTTVVYGQTNVATSIAVSAYGQANTGTSIAVSAYGQANTGTSIAVSAYGQANTAYNQANTATTIAVDAYNKANTVSSDGVNAAFGQANAAFLQANTANTIAVFAYGQANTAYNQANTATTIAVFAYGQANVSFTQANAAFTKANTANTIAVFAYGQANVAYARANTALDVSEDAYNQANVANDRANTGISLATTAYTQANLAFTKANTGGLTISTSSVNDQFFIMFTTENAGAIPGANVNATKLTFNPSTGVLTAPQFTGNATSLVTTNNYRMGSLGVGTAASGTTGEIRATNNITAYYSDKRLKENIELIKNPIEKIKLLNGVYFNNNDLAESFGYSNKESQVGVIAQEVQTVVPEAVKLAPFDTDFDENGQEYSISGENYLTVQYEKLIPLLIECIKYQQEEIELLKNSK